MSNDNPFATGGGYNVSFEATAPNAPQHSGDEIATDVTTAGFARDVIQESRQRPVLVDFWAPWCGPCKQLTPVLEKVVRDAKGAVKLVKMNIDEHPSIAGQLGIQSIPAVIAFKDGQPVDGFMGAVPESQIREFIARLGGDPDKAAVDDALAEADAALGEGDGDTAAGIYAAILRQMPDSSAAAAGLAGLLLDRDDVEAARSLLDGFPGDGAEPKEFAGARARIALADEVAKLGDPRELAARLDADPKDHAARFDLALIQNARGEREAAAESLLSIIRADREWRDDAARTQLLKFFEAWGVMDEATLSARRRLSSLLFS